MSIIRPLLITFCCGASLFLLAGCLMQPGPIELQKLIEKRGRVYKTVVFKRNPAEGEKNIEDFHKTLVHWTTTGSRGKPRWKGVLAPEPESLYNDLISVIEGGAEEIRLVSYRYDAVGIDPLTLIDYFDAADRQLGWDYVVYPEPRPPQDSSMTSGYDDLSWWEYPLLVFDFPIYLVIGIKEMAGEIAKSPLTFLETWSHGAAFENRFLLSPLSFKRGALGFGEDWQNGWAALTWRFRTHAPHTPFDTIRELIGIVPVVGPVFDHKTPPPGNGPTTTRLILISQGIHVDSDTEQMTQAWERGVEELRPETTVVTTSYRYGSVADVFWSLLNISHGMSYELAREAVFDRGIKPGESVELIGFSGGVQRAVAATKALRSAGVTVNKVVGVAAPAAGYSCARESHLLLGSNVILDPVVLSSRATNVLYPFPDNLWTRTIKGAGAHHTMYFPDAATRAPHLGYAKAFGEVVTFPKSKEIPNSDN